MGRNKQPRQRSQLPKNRDERFASFGFRHEIGLHNHPLHELLEAVDYKLKFFEEENPAKVTDPSKLSLKIVERYRLGNASRKANRRLNKSEVSAIKHDVRAGIARLGLGPEGIKVNFDRIVTVGDERFNGVKGKFAIAPDVGHESYEVLLNEHVICIEALRKWGIHEVRYPDSEWVPHLTVVASGELAPHVVGKLADAALTEIKADSGPIVVQFDPLQYYDEKTELMV